MSCWFTSASNSAGYAKPLFQDMQVYDPAQERHKPALRKVYEEVVSGVAKVLESRRRAEVATRAEITGRTDDPNVSSR